MSDLIKLRHRKLVHENFQKFISQERHIRILISGGYCFNLDSNQIHNKNMNPTKIVIQMKLVFLN